MNEKQKQLERLESLALAELKRRFFPVDIGAAEIHELAVWIMKEHRDLAMAVARNEIGHRHRN